MTANPLLPLLFVLGCAAPAGHETVPARAPAVDAAAKDDIDASIELGRKALEAKRVAEAQKIFDEAAAQDGSTLRTRTWVLRAWMEDGRVNDALDAIDALDKSGAKGPPIDYLYGMAFACKARGYLATGTGGAATQMAIEDAV